MWRCELCDSFLPLLSFGRLCENCYRIRTITKCYNSKVIRGYLESVFLVDDNSDSIEHPPKTSNYKESISPQKRIEIETRSKKYQVENKATLKNSSN